MRMLRVSMCVRKRSASRPGVRQKTTSPLSVSTSAYSPETFCSGSWTVPAVPRDHRAAMLRRRKFGILPDGTSVDVITLEAGGLEMNVLTYGCIIASLAVPDARGDTANVVLGFDRLEPYVDASPYFGAVVGRYANRIAHARFAIDGREHRVSPNEPPNHLHGGFKGFDKRMWEAEPPAMDRASSFGGRAPMAKKDIPEQLDVQVTYTLADRELRIEYQAVADAPTHVNLTQHSYFNCAGPAMCWPTVSRSTRARTCRWTSR